MKIISIHTHDSFNSDLCTIPNTEWYHITNKANGHIGWGGGSRPRPANLHDVPYETLADIDWSKYDICLVQSVERYAFLKDTPIRKIYLEHTVPYPLYRGGIHHQINADPNVKRMVYLTEQQVLTWFMHPLQVDVILPMIDVSQFPEWRTLPDRQPTDATLTVCNNLPARNWCCGWDVWRYNATGLPRILVGEGNEQAGKAAIGFRSGEEVKGMMHDFAVYFNTNTQSPIGTALLEAMAVGMPIVSTDRYVAHSFLTHSATSLNPKSAILSNVMPVLRAGLIEVLSEPERYRAMGQAARNTAREVFDPERFRMQWQMLFEEVLS